MYNESIIVYSKSIFLYNQTNFGGKSRKKYPKIILQDISIGKGTGITPQ